MCTCTSVPPQYSLAETLMNNCREMKQLKAALAQCEQERDIWKKKHDTLDESICPGDSFLEKYEAIQQQLASAQARMSEHDDVLNVLVNLIPDIGKLSKVQALLAVPGEKS